MNVPLRHVAGAAAVWRLQDEAGGAREGRATIRTGPGGATITLPALRPGYYELRVGLEGRSHRATIIAAPRRCWEPRALREGARLWGHHGPDLFPAFGAQPRHRRLYRCRRSRGRDRGVRGVLSRAQSGSCAVCRRSHEDLAVLALLAPVPGNDLHRPSGGRGPPGRRSRSAARGFWTSGRGSRRCARRRSSTMPCGT